MTNPILVKSADCGDTKGREAVPAGGFGQADPLEEKIDAVEARLPIHFRREDIGALLRTRSIVSR